MSVSGPGSGQTTRAAIMAATAARERRGAGPGGAGLFALGAEVVEAPGPGTEAVALLITVKTQLR